MNHMDLADHNLKALEYVETTSRSTFQIMIYITLDMKILEGKIWLIGTIIY